MATNPNELAAQNLQEKFELYLLGLAFTLLGLAIQTAAFDGPPAQQLAELVGWVLLLVSGLVGLLRLRWVPVLLRHGAAIQRSEDLMFQVQGADPDAEVQFVDEAISVRDFIASHKKTIADVEAIQAPLSKKVIWMGRIQTWSFVVGVCSVAIARAYVPIASLLSAWCR